MLKRIFFYPLYLPFDQKIFTNLLDAVKDQYEFLGSNEDKVSFVKSLLYYQVIVKDYRKLLRILNKNLAPQTDIRVINDLVKKTKFKKDISWVSWKSEKEMVKLAENFWRCKTLKIVGDKFQFDEFVLRYLVSIWLVDWSAPCFAILKSSEKGTVNLEECNEILALWDFTKIFGE